MSDELLKRLETDGIVEIAGLIEPTQLASMREVFRARLCSLRWSDSDGYEKTELFRQMVQDVLTLGQGFVDLALHPTVITLLRGYLGEDMRLVEAKGWKSLPTRRSFHAWHADAWYEQELASEIPREVKLGIYLTDVDSGEFQYIRGSHRKYHPRKAIPDAEVAQLDPSRTARMKGPAGSVFLFDTSGIHRQAEPILDERLAVFLAYHDPSVPLQAEDVDYHRYHPLILNAAFLGNLSPDDCRILGFGDARNLVHAFRRKERFPRLNRMAERSLDLRLQVDDLLGRVRARSRRVLGRA